jgi:hypothetical protein
MAHAPIHAAFLVLLAGCGDHWDEQGVAENIDHSFFPLEHSHERECTACHAPDSYGGLEPACSSCHEGERPPEHHAGTDCVGCHIPTTWGDVTGAVDHDFFPLQDAHAVDCASCHPPGTDESETSPVCASCHDPEEPEPGHRLSEGCDGCHVPTTWMDVFAHDPIFPIPHREANQCVECHTTEVRDEFSCMDACHEHDQGNTDQEHHEEPDYVWASWACYDCHPNGGAD